MMRPASTPRVRKASWTIGDSLYERVWAFEYRARAPRRDSDAHLGLGRVCAHVALVRQLDQTTTPNLMNM
jgi:hypothetical protein